ncbi:MAG: DUF2835 domain-containing protein [gamma proteobacterium symbiont of Taylorina sp.]|nr:DUF2835 domain-containing protein [gamma proteobacterium symbiont of Taylorina sp.]
MNEIRFRIAIDAQEYLRYYQGAVDSVQVVTTDGRRIQFPASALQKYVDRFGVNGSFRIVFDKDNKLVSIDRISN